MREPVPHTSSQLTSNVASARLVATLCPCNAPHTMTHLRKVVIAERRVLQRLGDLDQRVLPCDRKHLCRELLQIQGAGSCADDDERACQQG